MSNDTKTPDAILNCPVYQKALKEYQRLPEVTSDIWYSTGIGHLVYWAQHEIDLVDEGERQGEDDKCEVKSSDVLKLRKYVTKWAGIKANTETGK